VQSRQEPLASECRLRRLCRLPRCSQLFRQQFVRHWGCPPVRFSGRPDVHHISHPPCLLLVRRRRCLERSLLRSPDRFLVLDRAQPRCITSDNFLSVAGWPCCAVIEILLFRDTLVYISLCDHPCWMWFFVVSCHGVRIHAQLVVKCSWASQPQSIKFAPPYRFLVRTIHIATGFIHRIQAGKLPT
jgi:hypothetical protein